MAELVDALDSKSCYRKVVQVRFLFWARKVVQVPCLPQAGIPVLVKKLGLTGIDSVDL